MIRPFTCICLLLAAGSGLYLYSTKHRAQMLDRDISRLMKEADVARERAGVLRAEYALLSDPQRLKELATEHLSLRSTEPTQFTNWADFAHRLPPVGLPPAADPQPVVEAPAPTPATPAAVPVAQAAPARSPTTSKPDAQGDIAHADVAHVDWSRSPATAAAKPVLPAPTSLTAALVPAAPRAAAPSPAAHPAAAARSILASGRDAPGTDVAYSSLPPPSPYRGPATPFVATVATAPRLGYQPPPVTTAEAVARIVRGGPVDSSVPAVGSALGMARSMMRVPGAVTPANAAQFTPIGSGG